MEDKKNKPTPQQQQAIDSAGAVLVSAAAGSGKTSVLTQKVIKLITDEERPCDADRLLVVTFTNAAAAEMRTRIEKGLNAECEKDPSNKRLLRQKVLLANSSVCTIDAFCMDLVKENFYDLGIDPDFSIVNAGVFEGWKSKEVTRIMNEAFVADPETYKAVLDSMGSTFGDDTVKESIIKAYNYSRALKDSEGWLEGAAAAYEKEQSFEECIWVKWVSELASSVVSGLTLTLEKGIAKVREYVEGEEIPTLAINFFEACEDNLKLSKSILEYINLGAWDSVYSAIANFKNYALNGQASMIKKGGNMAAAAGIIAAIQGDIKLAQEKLSEYYYDVKDNVWNHIKRDAKAVRFIVDAAKKLDSSLYEKCRENGVFTFDMVEHMALGLLQSKAGEEIANRYEWVLVDEYQDVNELQGTIFSLLSRNEERLFAVGDVKQSIYGFRQADPKMFLAKKDSFGDYDGKNYPAKVILDANFRSRSGVCDFVNFCFGRLMSHEVCGMDYLGEDSLKPEANYAKVDRADVEFYAVDENSEITQPEAVAKYIKNAVASGMKIGQSGKEKAVTYGHFAILLRATSSHVVDYINALNAEGIPVNAEKEGFWESREVMMACSALKAISNPCDDISLLATLMAYPNGFTPDDVAMLRVSSDRDIPLYASLSELAESGNAKASEFLATLGKFRSIAASGSAGDVLNAVMEWLDIFNVVKFWDNSRNRTANLLRLISVAEDFGKGENGDLHSFCGFIRYNAENPKKENSAMAPLGEDAVRIMSIHKSKGLQFPVCIIARCDGKFNFDDCSKPIVMHEDFGISVDNVDLEECKKEKSLAKRVVASAIKNKLIAEELRLLYVAMTRAEDKLVFFSEISKPEEKLGELMLAVSQNGVDSVIPALTVRENAQYDKWLYMCLLNHPELHEQMERYSAWIKEKSATKRSKVSFAILNQPAEDSATKPEGNKVLADKEIMREIEKRVGYEYPFADLWNIASKTSVTALAKEEGESVQFSATPSFLSGTMLTPAQRGTALHKFMQFCDFAACEKNLEAEADRLEGMEYITETERDALDISVLKKLFCGDFYKKISKAGKILREQRFLSRLAVGEIIPEIAEKYPDESVVIQGAADCLLIESDGITVIDFKSDRVNNDEELVARYAAQLDIYGKVFSSIYGLPVKEKIIYSFKLGRPVNV